MPLFIAPLALRAARAAKKALPVLLFAAGCGVCLGQGPLVNKWTFGKFTSPNAVAYSTDSKKVAIGSSGGVQITTLQTSANTLVSLPTAASVVNSLSFSPDGTMIAVGGSYRKADYSKVGVAEVWSTTTGHLLRALGTSASAVSSVAFSSDSKMVGVGGQVNLGGGVLEAWTAATGALVKGFATKETDVLSVAISPDGKTLAGGGYVTNLSNFTNSGETELWTVGTGTLAGTLKSAASSVASIAFSPDGSLLADGGASSISGVLEIWSVSAQTLTTTFSTSANRMVSAVSFSPDGKTLGDGGLTTANSGIVELWDVGTSAIKSVLPSAANGGVNSVAFSPDGKSVCDGGTVNSSQEGGVFEAWSLSTDQMTFELTGPGNFGLPTLAFSSDGQKLVTGGSDQSQKSVGDVYLWNTATGASLFTLTTACQYVASTQFSPDGTVVAVGGYGASNGIIELWSAIGGTLESGLATTASVAIQAVAFSPDGKTLATLGQSSPSRGQYVGVLELWNVSNGAKINTLTTSIHFPKSLAFSPDGTMLAAGGDVAEVWNISTGVEIAKLNTAANPVSAFLFSHDGLSLVISGTNGNSQTSSPAGVLEIWNTSTLKLQQSLSPAQGTTYITSLAFSDNTQALFAGSDVGLQMFSWATDTLAFTYNLGYIGGVAVSPNANLIAMEDSGGGVNTVVIPALNTITVSALALAPASVQGGTSSLGTLTLSQTAPTGGFAIPITSNSTAATVPATVLVASGATTATFTITTSGVSTQTVVSITAGTGAAGKSANLTLTPATLSLISFSPSTVAGGSNSTGTATLSGPAGAGGVAVTLAATGSSATVPSSVIVPAGSSSGTFTVTTIGVTATTTAKVTATLNGASYVADLTITPAALALVSVTPSSVLGGGIATGTVSLSGNAAGTGKTISLTSSNAVVVVPKAVSVSAGHDSYAFTVKTVAVSSPKTVTITAKDGTTTKTTTLTVGAPILTTVGITPGSVAGGASATGTVNLSSAAPTAGMIVKLTSNSKSATVLPSVTIPGGKTYATFTIKTLAVSSQTVVGISASLNGLAATPTLTITAPALTSVTLSPTSVKGGLTSTGTVHLSSIAPTGGMKITLTSSLSSVTVLGSVTVLAGKTTATFTVKTLKAASGKTATISATGGTVTKTTALTIT